MSFKSKLLPTPTSRLNTPSPVRDELADLFDMSAAGWLLFEQGGGVLRVNALLQGWLACTPSHLNTLHVHVAGLLGWPDALPATGQQRSSSGWLPQSDGPPRHVRVTVRGLSTPGPRRWLSQFEDLAPQDERDLSRLEMAALMGSAGVGVASFDSARGWVSASMPPLAGSSVAAPPGTRPADASLMAISRELVEPASLGDYERLQQAMRMRERAEVRYAVRHPDAGRRWLQTRVESATLSDGRSAFAVVTLDVTQEENTRRRNDQLLHEMGTILAVSPAGIAYLRGDVLVRCNARFEFLLGLGAGTGPGLSIEKLLQRCHVRPAEVAPAVALLHQHGSFETEFQPDPEGEPAQWHALALRRASEDAPEPFESVALLTDVSRLRVQQAALEGLERENEQMFSLSDVGILFQQGGRVVRANPAMAELTGWSQAELQRQPLSALYEDERIWQAHDALEQRELQAHGRARHERRIRRADGSSIWVQVSLRPVRADDLSAGCIASYVSVDERRRARESLLTQAERTRAILDSVLVGIVTVSERGIEWMNRSARRMFHGELVDFAGLPISVVASDDPDHPLRRRHWFERLREGQTETFECKLVARDRREFWVVGNVVVTADETGAGQLTFALLDIERRRQAENQIAHARASLQRIIETAPLAIALFDAVSQQVLQLNQMLAQGLAHRSAAGILGRQPADWLPPAEAAELASHLQAARQTREPVYRELRCEPEAGSERGPRMWELRIVGLTDPGDGAEQLLMVASDVTEQRAADQARLEAAISQREMLVKEVHHRIKNNLQGVAGLLQQNAQRHPEASAAIAEAVGHVHAIAQVHGLQVGVSGPLRVRGVVEAICGSVQRMFGRPILVQIRGDDARRYTLTEADSIPIALTINELLTNAIKHSPADAIHTTLLFGGNEVRIDIANRGVLAPDFDLRAVPAGISGLGLVRALLPRKGAAIALRQQGAEVVASLVLQPPAVALLP